MGADVIALVEGKLGIAFKKRASNDWNAHLAALESGDCAVAPTIVPTAERQRFAFFTPPYATVPVVLITDKDFSGTLTFGDLADRRVAVVSGYATETYVRDGAPGLISLVSVANVPDGLRRVSFGQADVLVENLAVAAYYIDKEGIPNLRVAGSTPYSFSWSIGVSRRYPLLYSAVAKALAGIPANELETVRKRWISLNIEGGLTPEARRMLILVIIFTALLTLGLAGISYVLKNRLNEKIASIKEAQEQVAQNEAKFRAIFENAPYAIVISRFEDGRYLEANKAFLDNRSITRDALLQMTSKDFATISDEESAAVMDELLNTGVVRNRESEVRKPDGTIGHVNYSSVLLEIQGQKQVLSVTVDVTERKRAEEALKQSEARFRSLFTNAPIPLGNLTLDGVLTAVNDRFVQVLGYTKEDIKDLDHWWQMAYPDIEYRARVVETWRKNVGKALKDGTRVEPGEVRVTCKNGDELRMIVGATVIEDSLLVSFFDITALRQKEIALLESTELLRATFNTTNDGILVVDKDLKVTQANRQFYDMWRIPGALQAAANDVVLRDFIQDQLDDPDAFNRMVQALYESQTQDMYEIPFKDGRVFECYTAPVVLAEKVIGRVWDFRDITERKNVEKAIDFERRQLLSVFDNFSEIIYVSDPFTYEILFANRRLRRLIGKDPRGELCYKAFQGLDEPCSFCTNAIILGNNGRPYRWEHRNPITNIDLSIVDQIIRWPDGRDVRLEFAVDITERKLAEKEREKLQEQLVQSQKLEAVGTLAGGVAHDFNNMLGAIIGYAELTMSDMAVDDPLRKHVSRILDTANRSAGLTRQLLAFARKQTIAPIVFDLNEAVEDMLRMLRRLIGENIELAWLPGAGSSSVKLDPTQFDQILANLCVNARDAIETVGRITIETGAVSFDVSYCELHAGFSPGDFVMLAVSDDGCGMDEETLNHIFEPFFTTKSVGQGTGLGLATIYGIVKQNDGFITVYSEPGRGTTIKIYFPRHAEESGSTASGENEEIPHSRGETILIVEDDSIMLEMGKMMLNRLGYTVHSAATPAEAIRLAEETTIDIHLFLTDVVMPEMNGKDLADLIRKIRPQVRHLFMSGYTTDVIAHQGVLDAGVNFIHKPFSLQELAVKIREVLDG